VKHGEFYHPARVVVKYGQGEFSFVVNVAISKTGRDHLRGEFNLLARLFPEFELPALPKVYQQAEIPSGDNTKLPMFSGQWFEGFCEFHITADHPENMSNLIVWDQDDTRFYLTRQQAEDVYRQVAFILTTAYKFFTFEQISAWHHAAGDFILKPIDTTRVDLRLITIRKYAPLIENAEPDPATLIEALLLIRSIIRKGYKLNITGRTVKEWIRDDSTSRLMLTIGLCVIYALVFIGLVPYAVGTVLFIFAFILIFEYRRGIPLKEQKRMFLGATLVSVLSGVSIWVLFRYLFLVNLP